MNCYSNDIEFNGHTEWKKSIEALITLSDWLIKQSNRKPFTVMKQRKFYLS